MKAKSGCAAGGGRALWALPATGNVRAYVLSHALTHLAARVPALSLALAL
jgi:hypothetical protein